MGAELELVRGVLPLIVYNENSRRKLLEKVLNYLKNFFKNLSCTSVAVNAHTWKLYRYIFFL